MQYISDIIYKYDFPLTHARLLSLTYVLWEEEIQ